MEASLESLKAEVAAKSEMELQVESYRTECESEKHSTAAALAMVEISQQNNVLLTQEISVSSECVQSEAQGADSAGPPDIGLVAEMACEAKEVLRQEALQELVQAKKEIQMQKLRADTFACQATVSTRVKELMPRESRDLLQKIEPFPCQIAQVCKGIYVGGEDMLPRLASLRFKEGRLTHVISVMDRLPFLPEPFPFRHRHFKAEDTTQFAILDLLKEIKEFTNTREDIRNEHIFIHCRAGINRSMAIAIAMRMEQYAKQAPRTSDTSAERAQALEIARNPVDLLAESWKKAVVARGCRVLGNPSFQRQLYLYARLIAEGTYEWTYPRELWEPPGV
jgi:hypothetical protein